MVVACIALVLAAGGFAVAAIPGPDGVIAGCFKKKKGTLRVVDTRKKCRKGERRLTWNQKGVPGERGPAGSDAQFNGSAAGGDLTGTYPSPLLAPDSVGAAEVAPNALTDADINEATLSELTTGAGLNPTGQSCDPSNSTYVACGEQGVNLQATDTLVAIGIGGSRGTAAGADEGTCGLIEVGVQTTPPAGTTMRMGQAGAEHDTVGRDVPFTVMRAVSAEAPGVHTFRLVCNETAGDMAYADGRVLVLQLSG
jgi:hypothetical protein